MAFDPATGGLWVGDVGQVTEEEVDLVTRGGNYGWNVREGNTRHRELDPKKHPATDAAPEPFLPPVLAYGRNVGLSITGGYVYRGKALPALVGAYIYGDWAGSAAFYLRHDGARVTEDGPIGKLPNPNSFGRDDHGELFALALDGRVFRLTAGPPIPAPPFSEKPDTSDEPAVSEDALRALARNARTVARGAELFQRGCQACHGLRGEGGIGPNLTDDAWLRGSNLVEIHRSVSRGNPQAGMPPWAEIYGPAELQALTVFVASLSLGDPLPGKPPQGKPASITYDVAAPPRGPRSGASRK
jgi:mono/diheme cytochrome c family protein